MAEFSDLDNPSVKNLEQFIVFNFGLDYKQVRDKEELLNDIMLKFEYIL